MPARTDIDKILVIGSGPIIIGQACEFDYSGTQALKALREEGYRVVLVNSNPATIMTDPEMAWKVYIEPLSCEYIEKIIRKERPHALLPTLGGQTALNLTVELQEKGILDKYGVEILGAKIESIQMAESRELFKRAMGEIGVEVPRSCTAKDFKTSIQMVKDIGLPVIIRPAYTLGGTGGAVVEKEEDVERLIKQALDASPVSEILIEESVAGWKEIELELMRDKNDNCVIVCSIENLDPMGVHTGDSITVAPVQTLTDYQYQRMRDIGLKIMRKMAVDAGGSNIQFALDPDSDKIYAIEMNPRVSRSSALASKATGFPIAKIAAKLAVGFMLDEIPNDITKKTPACFEPAIDYVVTKVPRFTFEKFVETDQRLGSSMKSVGEVMAMGRTFKESIQKALRGLEIGRQGLAGDGKGRDSQAGRLRDENAENREERKEFIKKLKNNLSVPNCERIFEIMHAFEMGMSVEEIHQLTTIDRWYLSQMEEIHKCRLMLEDAESLDEKLLARAKAFGFSDHQIAYLTGSGEENVRKIRKRYGIEPVYKSVDTCAAEFESYTPYFYSCYEHEDEVNESLTLDRKVLIIGGGPNRIGQGIEFDYCICHASFALREEDYFSIIINSNPETVSTDYDTSDRLYFEPLTAEDIINVIKKEKPYGVIAQLGGQTPLNLIHKIKEHAKIIGTSPETIDLAEDRILFSGLLKKLRIPHPEWGKARSMKEAKKIVDRIGYPVMLRPSFVLGGRAMEIAFNDSEVEKYLSRAAKINPEYPVLIDDFLEDALEVDVDCICDGSDVFIAPLMEHIEKAGVHSGDSACVTPPVSLSDEEKSTVREYVKRMALELKVKGLMNVQCALKDGEIYVLEVNPRASRTVPFISKVLNIPLAKIATKVMLGRKLSEFDLSYSLDSYAVKEVVLPFSRFAVDPVLGPEMKSTGEVMGRAPTFSEAFYKAQVASGTHFPQEGPVLVSLSDSSKKAGADVLKKYADKYKIYATPGTADYLMEQGIKAEKVDKIGNSSFDVKRLVKNAEVGLIINTPSGKKAYSDGYWIRRWSNENHIPLMTTIRAARAFIEQPK
ncbi:MAG: carbamoyl-phosphate synthase large subunit [Elusimicrobiota bacterium]